MFVTDNFLRPDGALGGNWGTVFPFADSAALNPTPTGGIQLKSHAFAPITSGGDAALCSYTGATFANDQWACAQIATIAPFIFQGTISACSSSAGTSTYTYALTIGSALVVGQWIYVTGMTNSGNNSSVGFKITGLGVNTFSVSNASPGANESGSSGTGTIASDSICGVAVRCSSNGQNGYVLQFGTNSAAQAGSGTPVDQRVYTRELWKLVSGVATLIAIQEPVPTTVPDTVGDVYAIKVQGTSLQAFKNGVVLTLHDVASNTNKTTFTDSDLSSGSPGIGTWSLSGSGTWTNPPTYGAGNAGTSWTNFQGGDATVTSYVTVGTDSLTEYAFISDSIAYSNGDLHTKNANWVYEGSSAFTVSGNKVYYATTAQNPGFAYRSDAAAGPDQWAQCSMVITAASGTQNCGPAVRISASQQSAYYVSAANNLMRLSKIVNGTATSLGTSGTFPVTNSNILLTALGSTISVFMAGVKLIEVTDTDLTTGNAGISGAGNATSNGFNVMYCGTLISVPSGSNFNSIGFSRFAYSATGGGPLNNTNFGQTMVAIYSTLSFSNNHYSQGVITLASAPPVEVGPVVRIDSVNDTGYIFCNLAGTVYIKKFSGLTITTLNSATHAYVQNETYRLEAQGPLLVGKINGTIVVEAVDTTYSMNNTGIGSFSTSNLGGANISTWEGGNIVLASGGQVGAFLVGL